MSLFLRIYTHLLPTGAAWRLGFQKQITKFFDGLTGLPSDARAYADAVYQDLFPSTTRELESWEREFGLEPNGSEATRRLALAAAWASGGGQSPAYIESVLQTAGFNLFVHEWWSSGPPYVARDPRTYTTHPKIGTWQCSTFLSGPRCSSFSTKPRCNAFLANEPGYIVNKDLTRRPPPPVPDDASKFPFFIYIGAATFPTHATVDATRRDELERLILKIRPAQQWVVMLVNYV